MRRRDVLGAIGSAAIAWPMTARTQEILPAIGFLRSTPGEPFVHLLAAFREGLKETGFVDGKNVIIEQRYAENRYDRLPRLAADLVHRRVSVIVGNRLAINAARAATRTIPIIFVIAGDPVRGGLLSSHGRPEGNVTGVTFFGGSYLDAKRVQLLHDLVPDSSIIAILLDTTYPGSEAALPNVLAAVRAINRKTVVVKVTGAAELEPAFAKLTKAHAGALLVSGSPLFTSNRRMVVALAARYAIPAIYDLRDFVLAGGLASYASSITDAYRQAGVYAGRILKGARPSDLPVVQPRTFDLAINIKAAKALGIRIPPSILLRATEVIE